jgi:1-acyl-sn-glycerol-3-phosphate acyltransferase
MARLRALLSRSPAAARGDVAALGWRPAAGVSAVPWAAGLSAAERLPRGYALVRGAARRILEMLFELSVDGYDRLPADGPYIVAANHHNYLDGVVLGAAWPRRIAFLVMPRVYAATPLHPPFHRWAGHIPLNLARPDPVAIRRALRVLDGGGIIGIFPEGPFSVRGQLEPGQPGVAMLALRTGVPVVPVGILGTYQALVGRRCYLPRRHPLRVRIGAPRSFGRGVGGMEKRLRADVTRRIMTDIASLLS